MTIEKMIERRDRNRAEIARLKEIDKHITDQIQSAQDAEMVKVIKQNKVSMTELMEMLRDHNRQEETPAVTDVKASKKPEKESNIWEDTDEDN